MTTLRPYEAPSPMDYPTEPFSALDSPDMTNQDHDAGSDNILDTPKELKTIEANYFAYDAPHKIEFFDTTLTDYDVFKEAAFTAEELDVINTPDDPLYLQLVAARRELDQATTLKSRFTSPRTDRKLLKEIFESTRQAYIESKKPTEEEITPLARLTHARAQFAESSFSLRDGSIIGTSQKVRIAYQSARKTYEDALADYIDEMEATHTDDMTDAEYDQFMTSLKDHELGALAGEEANHYLSETTDDQKKSYFKKGLERFNTLSRPKKIACTIGAAAVASIGFGAIGGAAAVGGLIGAKFARNYVTGEAARINKYSDIRSQQERSVLFAGNYELSRRDHEEIQQSDDPNESYQDSWDIHLDTREEALQKEAARLTREKRRVYGHAAVVSAIPFFGGALAGTLTELSFPQLHGIFREPLSFSHPDTPATATRPQTPDTSDTPGAQPTPEEIPPSTNTPEVYDHVSPRAKYLYNDYAGSTFDITVPAGSSIWEQVEHAVITDHPTLSSYEQQRLVGNITKTILSQHPLVDPYNLPSGSSFTTSIPR